MKIWQKIKDSLYLIGKLTWSIAGEAVWYILDIQVMFH